MGTIVNITHKGNSLSEWTATAGDVSASAAAALGGSGYGMACLVTNTLNNNGGITITTSTTGIWRFRFYLDPNGVVIPSSQSNQLSVMAVNVSDWKVACLVKLGYFNGNYYLLVGGGSDAGPIPFIDNNGYAISDGPHYVELLVQRASVANNDGVLRCWIDGQFKGELTTLDNRACAADVTYLYGGAWEGMDGRSGTLFFDEFVVNDTGDEIGPRGVVTRSDDFERADGSPGANWSAQFADYNPPVIASGRFGDGTGARAAYWVADDIGPNQFSEITLHQPVGAFYDVVTFVRMQPATGYSYWVALWNANGGSTLVARLHRRDAGGYNMLGSEVELPTDGSLDGVKFRIEAVGNIIRLRQAGNIIIEAEDAAYAGGFAGVADWGGDLKIEAWEGGEVGEAALITQARNTKYVIRGRR